MWGVRVYVCGWVVYIYIYMTHVDVLGQELVARLVLAQHVAVDAGAGERAAEEEAEEPVAVRPRPVVSSV